MPASKIRSIAREDFIMFTKGIITAKNLADIVADPRVKILDASYGIPQPFALAPKIAGAQEFDIDRIADPTATLTHMLPSADDFAKHVGALGITHDDFVVIYDRIGMAMAAARAWWMFRVFGHDNVAVLDGGLPAWLDEGFDTTTALTAPTAQIFKARFRPELVRSFTAMKENLTTKHDRVLDARDPMRFKGLVDDPRPGMHSGHIPESQNLFFMQLMTTDAKLKSAEELQPLLQDHLNAPAIVASCGSGVTACMIALAFYRLGRDDVAIYDGSWSEWGQHPELVAK
jgi:thiosulfate/3-mercaptopyruvate sulfurtransferase